MMATGFWTLRIWTVALSMHVAELACTVLGVALGGCYSYVTQI